jgi:hypothetical protein
VRVAGLLGEGVNMDGIKQTIEVFKNIHKNKDIYVLGSGATLNYIDPKFFNNKITICVNEVGEVYLPKTKYVLTKHHPEAIKHAQEMPKTKVIVSFGDCGSQYAQTLPNLPNLYAFHHKLNMCENANVERDWPTQEAGLYVSWSSITSAMHFAAYLGAKNIILVGHDCGELNGQTWVNDYGYEINASEAYEAKQRNYAFEKQSISVKEKLQKLYNCNIYSLNPFINYNLEGITYRGKNAIN